MKPDVGSKGNQKAKSKWLKKLEDYSTLKTRGPRFEGSNEPHSAAAARIDEDPVTT
jgi:hypothetical protein